MPGPPKNPDAIRRNLPAGPKAVLPAAGREGPVPKWPLVGFSDLEEELWSQVWATPQAEAWEVFGWVRAVARYVRLCVAAEVVDAPVGLAGEVRQLEDRLGLSPMAMRRLEWTVADVAVGGEDEVSTRREERRKAALG